MEISENIIRDLLPLYDGGVASSDTRALVEDWLRDHPEQARRLRTIGASRFEARGGRDLNDVSEMKSLRATKRRLRWRSTWMGLGLFFCLAVFSFWFDKGGVHFFFAGAPYQAAIWFGAGVLCWIAYVVTGRGVHRAGL